MGQQVSQGIGFSRVGLIGAVAICLILAAALARSAIDYFEEQRVERATADAVRIANAVIRFHRDVGLWPVALDRSAPIDRLVTSAHLARGAGAGAGAGAANWGDYGRAVQLGKFLYDPSDAADPTSGAIWRGPYLDEFSISDPWGNAYVINSRYLPRGKYAGKIRHKVLVLSPGPDQKWQTPYSDAATEDTHGDDIAELIYVTN